MILNKLRVFYKYQNFVIIEGLITKLRDHSYLSNFPDSL